MTNHDVDQIPILLELWRVEHRHNEHLFHFIIIEFSTHVSYQNGENQPAMRQPQRPHSNADNGAGQYDAMTLTNAVGTSAKILASMGINSFMSLLSTIAICSTLLLGTFFAVFGLDVNAFFAAAT
jgi:hypothetical protein